MINELSKTSDSSLLPPQEQIQNAHQFLKDFLDKFDEAKRGGIHDFMEIALYNMINASIKEIDNYLSSGYHEVNATQIMHIIADAWQKILDEIKRNLGDMKPVNFR